MGFKNDENKINPECERYIAEEKSYGNYTPVDSTFNIDTFKAMRGDSYFSKYADGLKKYLENAF